MNEPVTLYNNCTQKVCVSLLPLITTAAVTMAIGVNCISSNGYIEPKTEDFPYLTILESSGISSDSFDYNGITFSFTGGSILEKKLEKNIQKIQSFSEFDEDWNGYSASAFDHSLIQKAVEIIKGLPIQPEVFPVSSGEIQFEFEEDDGRYLELLISNSEQIEVFLVNVDGEESEFLISQDIQKINQLVDEFYG